MLVVVTKQLRKTPVITETGDFKRMEARLDHKMRAAIEKINEVSKLFDSL